MLPIGNAFIETINLVVKIPAIFGFDRNVLVSFRISEWTGRILLIIIVVFNCILSKNVCSTMIVVRRQRAGNLNGIRTPTHFNILKKMRVFINTKKLMETFK